MPLVVIQPSFGNPAARRHWRDTLDTVVDFTTHSRSTLLSPEQRKHLDEFHPNGTARFWGATGKQDKNMKRLSPGDIVLFTGKNRVRGVGEIGSLFRNADFADSMWTADPKNGSWHNVYSLLSFAPTDIPYTEVWALPGFTVGDNFMGLRILSPEKGATVLDGLGINPQIPAQQDESPALPAGPSPGNHTEVVNAEGIHTHTSKYTLLERELIIERAEALLLREYTDSLSIAQPKRLRTPAGITDLHLAFPEGSEVVEAKRGSSRRFVREALAQLLDYAPHTPEPAIRLTALFPKRPTDHDLALLHRYGLDCVYRTHPGTFERAAAPQDARNGMMSFWQ